MVGTRFMVQWEEHPSHLSTRLGRLLEAQAFVDVTLMCATHSLRVHGSVLAACSPYFEELLKLQVGHHPLIMLKDMKFCVLRALIEFMYCGETSITEADLRPLLDAAKFFKVKGLSSMTAEVLSDLPQSKVAQASNDEAKNVHKIPQTTTASTLSTSGANFPGSSKKTSIVRPRKSIAPPKIDSVAVEMNDTSGLPPDESAQILLSLSGNNKVVQRGSRGRGSSSRVLTQGPGRPPNKPIVINNCSFGSSDPRMETRSKLVNTFEPRRRGRKKQQFSSISSSNRELLDHSSQSSLSSLKSFECSSASIIDNFRMLHRDARYSKLLCNSNDPRLNAISANMEKSPLLASLLSKDDCPANKKNSLKAGTVDIKSPSASGSAGYLEALKAAGLPTDVPIIVDTGDGNYVTLTEDVFMDVMSSHESLQFQVTEETLDDSVSITEGVVMQDGSIVTEEGRELVAEPHSSKKLAGHFKQYSKPEPQELYSSVGGKSIISNDKSDITETVIETLKSSTSDDSDAVVLVEVKGNQVVRYVVSSKEIDALKALNEEKKWQKSGFDSARPISNSSSKQNSTKIAEINLTLNDSEAPKKSYITEFIETGNGLASVAKAIRERLPVKVCKESLPNTESNSSAVDNVLVNKVDNSKLSTNHAYEALVMMCSESEVKDEPNQKPRQSNIENIELMQNSEMEISNIGSSESHFNTNGVEYIYVSEESQLQGIDPSLSQAHLINGATRNVVLVKNKNGTPDSMSVEQAIEAMMGSHSGDMESFTSLQAKDSKSDALKQCLGEGEDEQGFQYVLDSNSVDKEMMDDSNSSQSYSNMVLYSNKDPSLEDAAGVSKYQMVDDQFSDRMQDNKMLSNILINSTPEMEDELIMNEENDVKSLGMINQVLNTTDQLNENDVNESSGYHSASIEFQEENENSAFGDENGVVKEENALSKETVFSESSENNYQLVENSEKSEDFCAIPKNPSSALDVPYTPKLKSNSTTNVSDRVLRKRRSSSSCDSKRNSMRNSMSGEKRSKLLNDNHNDNMVIMGNGDENILEDAPFFGNGQTDTMISSQLIDSNNLS